MELGDRLKRGRSERWSKATAWREGDPRDGARRPPGEREIREMELGDTLERGRSERWSKATPWREEIRETQQDDYLERWRFERWS